MKKKEIIESLVGFLIVAAVVVFSYYIGGDHKLDDLQKQAIDNGTGQYFINDDNEKEFRWIKPTK